MLLDHRLFDLGEIGGVGHGVAGLDERGSGHAGHRGKSMTTPPDGAPHGPLLRWPALARVFMETPMRLRHFAAALAILVAAPLCSAQDIHFAQLTDPHIFDSEGKPGRDSRPDNERCLTWAIAEVNRRNEQAHFDFAVITGDFGLEKVNDDKAAAPQLIAFLTASHVKRWLLVPGNNDLTEERPTTISHFHAFIAALNALPHDGLEILDFAPASADKADSATLDIGRCRFIGFDNASFKCNRKPEDADAFAADQQACVKAVATRLAAPPADPSHPVSFAYIFCHIPHLYDPH